MTQELRIRNYSERTVRSYITSISQLSIFYKSSPDKITRDQVKNYAYHLIHSKNVSVSRINQLIVISAWKIFQVDVLGNQWKEFRLKRPRREKKIPQVLSQEEALRLINTPVNMKHRMILILAYATGLRRAELLSLPLKHIDSSRSVVRVIKGKGNKSREVPTSNTLISELRQYYKYYRPSTYLFEGTIPGKPYSAASFFHKIVKDAANKAGIKNNISSTYFTPFFCHAHARKRDKLKTPANHSWAQRHENYFHLPPPGRSQPKRFT
jgi:integrase/recombinase XerD